MLSIVVVQHRGSIFPSDYVVHDLDVHDDSLVSTLIQ